MNNISLQTQGIEKQRLILGDIITDITLQKNVINTYWNSVETQYIDAKLNTLLTKLNNVQGRLASISSDINISANEILEEQRAAEEAARKALELEELKKKEMAEKEKRNDTNKNKFSRSRYY